MNKIQTVCEPAKETAKKIRVALKANFPGVKFSVRTDVYSGGSSVDVSWTDLPLAEEVDKVVNQFNSGSFDGMTDMYETTGYIIDGIRYVGAKYIFTRRELSEERKEMIKNWMKENYFEVNENSYDYFYHFNKAEKMMMDQQTSKVEVVEVAEVIENNSSIEKDENVTVEMNLNQELNGVELKFSGVPSEATRQLLKENGFRWSKYNKVWYSKQSTKTIMFAEALVSAYNDTIEEVEEIPTEEQNNVVEVQEMALTLTEKAANDGILLNDSNLVGRKVFGQWGVMAGWNYGVITAETIYNEVIVKWEDEEDEIKLGESYQEIKDLIIVTENTHLDAIGVYLMPIEETKENPYNSEVLETVNGYTCHFKAWYMEVNEIEARLQAENIPYSLGMEKFFFVGLSADQYETVQTINKENGSILFDDSFESEHVTTEPIEQPEKPVNDNKITFLNSHTLEEEKQHTSENKQPGKVLDFSSKFKQKQEQKETEDMKSHFLNNVLPYMEPDEINDLQKAYLSKDESQLNQIWQKLMLTTAVRRAADEIQKQN